MTPLPMVESCEGCGACCEHVGYPPFVWVGEEPDYPIADEGWRSLPEQMRKEITDHIDAHCGLPDGTYGTPCLWYDRDAKKCLHYELRPQICREFEVGSKDCLSLRADRGAGR
jgi:Fe-S-cluster containining protein